MRQLYREPYSQSFNFLSYYVNLKNKQAENQLGQDSRATYILYWLIKQIISCK